VFGITTTARRFTQGTQGVVAEARHQLCEFHVIKEITKAVLHALAKLRKEMTAQIPKQGRGRPKKEQEGQAWMIAYRKRCVGGTVRAPYLFVRITSAPPKKSSCRN